MNFCKDCGFRAATHRFEGKSLCTCPKLTSDSYSNPEYSAKDSLIYSYDEGGAFYVGDDFGCVHFKKKAK